MPKAEIFRGVHFGRYGNCFIVYNRHLDAVTLPKDFIVLASTDRCENSFIRHRKKLIYGAQFHPDDPDMFGSKHGINQHTNQDSDTIVPDFEEIVLKNNLKIY